MYWPSVTDLQAFYSSTLGGVVRSHLRRAVRERWPDAHEHASCATILGFGYTGPYLREMLAAPRNLTLAACPGPQGARAWPAGGSDRGNLSLHCADTSLPFADNSMDRILLAHALEFTHNPPVLLEELWRVLKPQGRLLVLVPNRRSIWARRECTPFGYGHPFSQWQLKTLLEETGFSAPAITTELFFPPSNRRGLLQLAGEDGFWNKLQRRFLQPLGFGGVLMAEAEKQIAAPLRVAPEKLLRYRGIAGAVPSTPTPREGI